MVCMPARDQQPAAGRPVVCQRGNAQRVPVTSQQLVVGLTAAIAFTVSPAAVTPDESAADGSEANSSERALDPGVWTSADGTTVVYESTFFEPYTIVTAADMLRWVPGGAAFLPDDSRRARNEPEKRGFGSGGDQILINGKRMSGKSNDIGSAIGRIQAGVVDRIEVIRGTTAGLDVRSEGTLFNIVLTEEIPGGSGSWQVHSGFYGDSPEYDGLLSYSDSAGSLNYLVSVEFGPYNRGGDTDRFDDYFSPGSNILFEHHDIDRLELEQELVFSTSAGWSFDNGDHLNLNGRIADKEDEENETTIVTVVGDPDRQNLLNLSLKDGLDWEIGGDLENRLGNNGVLKTRLIYSNKSGDESELVEVASSVAGNVPSRSVVLTDQLATETILRSSFAWPLNGAQNLELGFEGAINVLEKQVELFETFPDGSHVPIDVFNAISEVEENRYEFFSTHFWQLREDLGLESALNVEYSRIDQTGIDVQNTRSFTYVKPRFDLRWDLDDATQLRGSLERTISQLDFEDFVASFDNEDDKVNAGNPDLEPEKAWQWKLTWERRLRNDGGLLEARLFYNDIEDHIDRVAATDVISASGNIGDATLYGITLKGSWRLVPLGLEGAVIDVEYTWEDSEAIDPFTGEKRPMRWTPSNKYSVNFRHDIADWKINYNVDISWWGERQEHEITYRDRTKSLNPNINAGIQYRLANNLLLWFDTKFVIDSHHRRVREQYDGNIGDDLLLRTEVRDQYRRTKFILGLRGQF